VWFDYDDGKHFMRQAVALGEDRAFSLVLSANSADARNSQIRSFDQTLRTLRPLTTEELGAQLAPGTAITVDAGVVSTIDGGNSIDAGSGAPAPLPESVNPPASKINPIGSCTK
jgi:hypothetical protein